MQLEVWQMPRIGVWKWILVIAAVLGLLAGSAFYLFGVNRFSFALELAGEQTIYGYMLSEL